MLHLSVFYTVHTLTSKLGGAFQSESKRFSAKAFFTCSVLAAVLLLFGGRCCGAMFLKTFRRY